jgi:hypothetical protein
MRYFDKALAVDIDPHAFDGDDVDSYRSSIAMVM